MLCLLAYIYKAKFLGNCGGRAVKKQYLSGLQLTSLVAVATLGQIGVCTAQAATISKPLDLVINTDGGVDDAAAIVWLLTQEKYPVNVLGFSVVAGDTTVENAANNVLTLLDTLGQDIPVVIGAAEPLSQPLSRTGSFLHGSDGLWGAQTTHDLSSLSDDVPSFYNDLTQTNPGATLLSLGPLTNLAQTLDEYPKAMNSFDQIIAIGGAKNGGNITPVAEFNVWQDPDAAEELLSADLPTTLIPLDAFEEFTLTDEDIQALQKGTEAAQLIAGPLERYADVQTQFGGSTDASIPDLTAAMYAVDESLGTTKSALVKVLTESNLARGETVTGLTLIERLSMIASDAELSELAVRASDPNFDLSTAIKNILAREPYNAQIVTDIEAERMHELFFNALTPAPVPEPSSVLGLLTLGAFGVASLKRKQRMNSRQSSKNQSR